MSKNAFRASTCLRERRSPPASESRAHRVTPVLAAAQDLDLGALAEVCQALGDEGRFQLFRRIAAAGRGGLNAVELDADDAQHLGPLVAVGLVTPSKLGAVLHYYAQADLLAAALHRLSSAEALPH